MTLDELFIDRLITTFRWVKDKDSGNLIEDRTGNHYCEEYLGFHGTIS